MTPTTPSPISDQAGAAIGEPECTCAVRLMPGQIGATHSQDCPITAWGRAVFKASGENAQASPAPSENATEFFDKADETFEKWWDRSSGDFPTGFHSWEAACRQAWYAALATAPTTGSAPEPAGYAWQSELDKFASGEKAWVQLWRSPEKEAGEVALYAAPASPAASVMQRSVDAWDKYWSGGRAESDAVEFVKAISAQRASVYGRR